tara:strand:+ start:2105 stop:3667 length:1563 start_codon:yes stop_codon:yes gene_type:complete
MIRISGKLDNEMKIPGAALASTIKVLAGLGSLGERVLKEHGVTKIDNDKEYPSHLRARIFEEIRTRFGKEALYAIGLEQGFLMLSLVPSIGKFIDDFRRKYKKELLNHSNFSKNLKILDQTLPAWEKVTNDYLGQMRNNKVRSKLNFIKKGPGKYDVPIISSQVVKNKDFFEANYSVFLISMFSEMFDIKMSIDEENSKDMDNGFSKYQYTITFKQLQKTRSYKEHLAEIRFDANQLLLQRVLEEAEQQKNIVQKQKEDIEKLSSKLGKYLPPQIHKALFSGQFDTGIATKRKKLTIFFSDIKNFTSSSEGLQPEDLTRYLNEYFSEMTDIALNHGATIDKYIGDAMMVFFGDPESKGEREDARACVNMALKMQKKIKNLQSKWRNEGFYEPFQIRMGINTGYCNVGNFGSEQRLTYTIIGGEVNIAQRLEAAAPSDGILLSYESYAHAQDIVEVEELSSITMKGINREIKVFSVISDFKSKKLSKDKDEVSSVKSKKDTLESRIDKLEKLVANLVVNKK